MRVDNYVVKTDYLIGKYRINRLILVRNDRITDAVNHGKI